MVAETMEELFTTNDSEKRQSKSAGAQQEERGVGADGCKGKLFNQRANTFEITAVLMISVYYNGEKITEAMVYICCLSSMFLVSS